MKENLFAILPSAVHQVMERFNRSYKGNRNSDISIRATRRVMPFPCTACINDASNLITIDITGSHFLIPHRSLETDLSVGNFRLCAYIQKGKIFSQYIKFNLIFFVSGQIADISNFIKTNTFWGQ